METIAWVLLYLVFPLALGVLGNIATPWIKSFFTKGFLSLRERRLSILLSNYKYIKRLEAVPELRNSILISKLAWGLIPIVVVVALFGSAILWLFLFPEGKVQPISDFFVVIGVALFGVAMVFYMYLSIAEIVDKVRRFDTYKKNIIANYKKLGGNPEDLDKEETEGG